MKKILALLLILTLSAAVVGCGKKAEDAGNTGNTGNTDGQSGNVGSDSKEPVTIRFSWWGGDGRHQATLDVIKLFQEKYPHITVLPEYSAFDGYYEKLATQLIAKTEPDLMQVNFNWYYNFSPDGEGFYDLTKLNNLKLDNWEPNAYEALTMNGKVQGVPTGIGGRVYYFNKTTFDKAGIEVPTTIEELLAAGPIFKEKLGNGYYPFGALGNTDGFSIFFFGYLSRLTGKPYITQDNKLAFTEDEVTKGFELISKMLEDHVIPYAEDDSAPRDQKNPNWIEGRYAGLQEWNSAIGSYVDTLNPANDPNIVLAPFLTLDGQKHNGSYNKITMAFSISKNSKYPEEAALLLDFLFTDEEAVVVHGLQRAVPVNKVSMDILEDAGMLSGLQYEGHLQVQELAGVPYHPFYEDGEVKAAYFNVFEEYLYGKTAPRDAAKRLINDFNNALKLAMSRNN